jgi:homoserine dehydrogenase
VPLIVVTHRAKEQDIQNALEKIHKLNIVKSKTLLIRIDDE